MDIAVEEVQESVVWSWVCHPTVVIILVDPGRDSDRQRYCHAERTLHELVGIRVKIME